MWTHRSLKVPFVACPYCSPSLAAFNFNWINLKIDVYFTYLLHIALCFLYIFFLVCFQQTQTQTYTYRESLQRFLSKSVWTNEFKKKNNSKQSKWKRTKALAIICDIASNVPCNTYVSHVTYALRLFFGRSFVIYVVCVFMWAFQINCFFFLSNCKCFGCLSSQVVAQSCAQNYYLIVW